MREAYIGIQAALFAMAGGLLGIAAAIVSGAEFDLTVPVGVLAGGVLGVIFGIIWSRS